jgi:hypothetical protein
MTNSSKKIDFKEEKLSVDTIANASKWWEQARDEFVQVGLSQQLSVGPSLEERVRTAQVKVDTIEKKEAKREKIEEVPMEDRTKEQKDELKIMTSLKMLTDASTAAKNSLRDVEKKLEDSNRKNRAVSGFVRETVDEPLWRVFKEARELYIDDMNKQVIEGIKAIKTRLLIAPNVVLAAHKNKVTKFTTTYAVTIRGALAKLDEIDAIYTDGKELEKFLGKDSGSLTDDEAISAVRQGIKYKHGDNNVTQAIQDVLDSVDDEKKTWKEFCSELRKKMESSTVRSLLDNEKGIEDDDTASTFKAAATGPADSRAFAAAVDAAVDKKFKTWQGQQPTFPGTAFNAFGSQTGVPWQGFQQQNPYAFNTGQWQPGPPGNGSGNGQGGGAGGKSSGVCFAFQKGKCERGDKCRFQHVIDNSIKDNSTKKKVCFYDGTCMRTDCSFDHPKGKNKGPGTPVVGDKRKK